MIVDLVGMKWTGGMLGNQNPRRVNFRHVKDDTSADIDTWHVNWSF